MSVRLQNQAFDPGAETNAFLDRTGGGGAAVTFTGLVRSTPDHPVTAMTLEHYPALAQRQLEDLHEQAIKRFDLIDAEIIHRYGTLHPGDPIVQVMTLSKHRHAAFEAANFLMDTLKTNAPFWKKEEGPSGTKWVDARESDDDAAARWQ
ncbi:molybdenum cofactor biosynthesis protein MoaE [Pelagibacterium xiamenense]|uniref:molybdenum cofactor biosynthesis protein MoaE n=1 Tax=Pelagibacterium xiamenense TaxID=2901140 RepID=UPI001E581FD0|nr:molybdenum cofactor biosynthesis protein MoaE [Pelagibacterium xiamenense]MCD7060289.1 molybdenum cofactor biosynthesis protein MoaE [Pelagibacterium xiamenense]